MNDTPNKNLQDSQTQRKFWGTIALAGILFLVCIYYLIAAFQQDQTVVNSIVRIFFLATAFIALTSVGFVLRSKQDVGAKVLFYTMVLLPILAGALIQGRTLTASAVILVLAGMTIRWLLPISSWRWYSAITAASLVLAGLFEWIHPAWRVTFHGATLGPLAVVAFVIILVALAAREAFASNLRTRLVAAFLVVTLIPLALTAYINDRSSRQALTTEANDKLGGAAEQTAALLDEFMTENTNAVRTEAQLAAIVEYTRLPVEQRAGSSEEARLQRFLIAASRADPVYLNSIALLNPEGVTIIDSDSSGIGQLRADRYYFQKVLETNRAFASTVEYDRTTGKPSIYFAAPVHDVNGAILAVLRKRFNADVLMEYISSQKGLVGSGSFAVLLDENQMRLAHAANASLVFKLVVPLEPVMLTDLQSKRLLPPGTIEQLATNRPDFSEGLKLADEQPYFSADLTGDDLLEQVAVSHMKTQNWQVAFAVPQAQFLAPINTQARNNILMTIGIAFLVAIAGMFVSQTLAGPIQRLTQTAEAIAGGDITVQAKVETADEIGTLAGTFNRMTQQLRDFINTLESRVAERTRNLELAAEVGRTVSQVRALDVMLTDAAELIRKQFDLYYVQVYLINASKTYLNLQAGTGHVGKELLGRNHRLPFNADSINGRAAVERKSVVISNTTASATFKPNPLLPETRSEMAVPLLIGDRVVGVLDMQSQFAGSLSLDALPAFEALAGQLAIAIQNASFLAETEQARAEVEAQAKRMSRANWVDYLDAIHKPEETGYVFEQNRVQPLLEAVEAKEDDLVFPLSVTGEELGNIVVELEGQSPITRTHELLSTVARQVSQQIENLRLLDSAERYRIEAEEASRRLTREGWKAYIEEAGDTLGYVYDLKEVRAKDAFGDEVTEMTGYTLPLKVRDEAIGKLVIQGIDESDKDAVDLSNAVAERLAAHIESLRQFEETQRGQFELDKRARQLAAVAEVSAVSSRELDIEKMLQSVVHLTQRKFGLYHAHVFIHNSQSDLLQIAACGWKEGDEHEGTHGTTSIPVSQEQSLVARAARTRQAVIINNVRNEPDWLPNPLLPDSFAELAVPLIIADKVLGVLDVQADHIDAFTDEDASIYSTLASQIATALQNAQSFAQAQQQAERESRLNIISQKIQSATTVEAVLQIAARELGHTLGAPLTIAQLGLKETASGN